VPADPSRRTLALRAADALKSKSRRALRRRLFLATGSTSGTIASDRRPGHESKPAKSRCALNSFNMSSSLSADKWPDDVRLSDLEPRFTCQACRLKGADVRPNFDWEMEAQGAKSPVPA
jgi:hypothetical protein